MTMIEERERIDDGRVGGDEAGAAIEELKRAVAERAGPGIEPDDVVVERTDDGVDAYVSVKAKIREAAKRTE